MAYDIASSLLGQMTIRLIQEAFNTTIRKEEQKSHVDSKQMKQFIGFGSFVKSMIGSGYLWKNRSNFTFPSEYLEVEVDLNL